MGVNQAPNTHLQGVGHPQTGERREIVNAIYTGQTMESNGEQCLMTYHHGQQYTTTTDVGRRQEFGKASIENCSKLSEKVKVETKNRV